MASIRSIQIQDGRHLVFEEDVPPDFAAGDAGVGMGGIDFAKSLAAIKSTVADVATELLNLPSAPETIELTFGVKLSTEAGAILAKAGGEANFEVKLGWSRPASKPV